jgi:lipid-binding SYLF domain-containing protein
MKKLFFVLAMLSLAVAMADATEQDTVNRCAAIISQFQQMPEKAIPRDVLRQAKGLAIMRWSKQHLFSALKAGRAS